MAKRSTKKPKQLGFELPPARTWGGARKGAGRKPTGARPRVPHAPREAVGPRTPLHVTVPMAPGVPNLRSARVAPIVVQAIAEAREGDDFRIVEWVVLPSHLHLVVECTSAAARTRGMQSLLAKIRVRLRRAIGLTGPLVADRFHVHVLVTLRENVHAIRYVRDNWRRHLVEHATAVEAIAPGCGRFAELPQPGWRDPLSSAAAARPGLPRSWLLRTAAAAVGT